MTHPNASKMSYEGDFTLMEAKSALIDLLNALQSSKHHNQIEALKMEAGEDMIKRMQIVFPVVTKIQVRATSLINVIKVTD